MPRAATVEQLITRVQRERSDAAIASFFEDAQETDSVDKHRPLAHKLLKVHQPVPYPQRSHLSPADARKLRDTAGLASEKKFSDAFLIHLFATFTPDKLKGQEAKDAASAANNVFKAVRAYLNVLNENAADEAKIVSQDDESLEQDTHASRFTEKVLKYINMGMSAATLFTRRRVVTAAMFIAQAQLGDIDEVQWNRLRENLIKRFEQDHDKAIRVNAARALCITFSGSIDLDIPEEEEEVVSKLLTSLESDPAKDMRKTILDNLPLHEKPSIRDRYLNRLRDSEPAFRKKVYERLQALNSASSVTSVDRCRIITAGCQDRDQSVVRAAGRLIYQWFLEAAATCVKPEDGVVQAITKYEAFLEPLDVFANPDAAAMALEAVLTAEKLSSKSQLLSFDETFWDTLDAREAFIARVYLEYLQKAKTDELKELFASLSPDPLSVATAIERLHKEYENDNYEGAKGPVLREVIQLALILDYSDTFSAKKMDKTIKPFIVDMSLPSEIQCLAMELVLKVEPDTRDLVRQTVETLSGLYAPGEEDQDTPYHDFLEEGSSSPVKRTASSPKSPDLIRQEDDIKLRCLQLSRTFLRGINITFESNSSLEGLRSELVVACLKHTNLEIQELAYQCLGLLILIDKKLVLDSYAMITHELTRKKSIKLKMILIQTSFDMINMWQHELLSDQQRVDNSATFFLECIDKEEEPEVQALLHFGLAKLVMSGVLQGNMQILARLFCSYFASSTEGNDELRQSLSLFLTTYSRSSPTRKTTVAEIFTLVFKEMYDPEVGETNVPPVKMVDQFLEWTDPTDFQFRSNDDQHDICRQAERIHIDMAETILKHMLTCNSNTSGFEPSETKKQKKEQARALFTVFKKISKPDEFPKFDAQKLVILIDKTERCGIAPDKISKTTLSNFKTYLETTYDASLDGQDASAWREFEELRATFAFLDDIFGDDDDDGFAGGDEEEDVKPILGSKRARISARSKGSSSSDDEQGSSAYKKLRTSTPVRPRDGMQTRAKSKTKAAPPNRPSPTARRSPSVICISSDEDEAPVPPPAAKAKGKGKEVEAPPETISAVERDMSGLLDPLPESPLAFSLDQDDSIISRDSPEEDTDSDANEVRGLLEYSDSEE